MPMTVETDSKRQYDINGWMEVPDNPISRVGVYPYLGKNIAGAPDPDKFYNVYRSADELRDPECLASFRLVPWIDNHTMLGEGEKLTRPEDKPIEGTIGEQIYFDETDGDGVIKANIKVWTRKHQTTIDMGKRELSIGYRCKYDPTPGEFNGIKYDYVQRIIRGNHLASINDGRMGPDVAVMDQSDGFSFTVDSKEFIEMPGTVKKGSAVKPVKKGNKVSNLAKLLLQHAMDAKDDPDADTGEVAQLSALVEKVAPLLDSIAALPSVTSDPELDDEGDPNAVVLDGEEPGKPAGGKPAGTGKDSADPEGKGAPAGTGKDADDEAGKGKKGKDGEAMDASDMKQFIAQQIAAGIKEATKGLQPAMDEAEQERKFKRNAKRAIDLAEKLSHFCGVFDHSEMTVQDVAAYGVTQLKIPGVAKGHEVPAIEAYLHGRVAPTMIGRRGAAQVADFAMDGADPAGNAIGAYINGFGATE